MNPFPLPSLIDHTFLVRHPHQWGMETEPQPQQQQVHCDKEGLSLVDILCPDVLPCPVLFCSVVNNSSRHNFPTTLVSGPFYSSSSSNSFDEYLYLERIRSVSADDDDSFTYHIIQSQSILWSHFLWSFIHSVDAMFCPDSSSSSYSSALLLLKSIPSNWIMTADRQTDTQQHSSSNGGLISIQPVITAQIEIISKLAPPELIKATLDHCFSVVGGHGGGPWMGMNWSRIKAHRLIKLLCTGK